MAGAGVVVGVEFAAAAGGCPARVLGVTGCSMAARADGSCGGVWEEGEAPPGACWLEVEGSVTGP